MWRTLARVVVIAGVSGCGSSLSARDQIVGNWLHDPDAAHPEIPPAVAYFDDGTMQVSQTASAPSGSEPGPFEGHWSIDSRNFLLMNVSCLRIFPSCPFMSLQVNYLVSAQSLTWRFGDGTEWRFHR